MGSRADSGYLDSAPVPLRIFEFHDRLFSVRLSTLSLLSCNKPQVIIQLKRYNGTYFWQASAVNCRIFIAPRHRSLRGIESSRLIFISWSGKNLIVIFITFVQCQVRILLLNKDELISKATARYKDDLPVTIERDSNHYNGCGNGRGRR